MSDLHHAEDQVIAPVPRITIQAFCETPDVAASIQAASEDRRMQKTQLKVLMGGAPAAVEAYRHAPTPNVIVLESLGERSGLLAHLDQLSEVCDGGTKVVVVGHVNDVILYRELVRRGVSEYIIAPVAVLDVVRSISDLFCAPGAEPVGRTISVVGAKGGVGSSTVAHNLGWATARQLSLSTVVVDLDIAFGTAGLDFNQDPPQGIAEAIFAPERLDANLVDRRLSKCSDNLSLLAARRCSTGRRTSSKPLSMACWTSCGLRCRASSLTCRTFGRLGFAGRSSAPTRSSSLRRPSSRACATPRTFSTHSGRLGRTIASRRSS